MDEVSRGGDGGGDDDDAAGDVDGDGAASPTPAPGWECPSDLLVDNTTGQEISIA